MHGSFCYVLWSTSQVTTNSTTHSARHTKSDRITTLVMSVLSLCHYVCDMVGSKSPQADNESGKCAVQEIPP